MPVSTLPVRWQVLSYSTNNNSYHSFLFSNSLLTDLVTLGVQSSQSLSQNYTVQITASSLNRTDTNTRSSTTTTL